MDLAYYEDLAGRLNGLLIGLGDRLESEQAQLLHHFIDVGEYGLLWRRSPGLSLRTKSPSPIRSAATCSR